MLTDLRDHLTPRSLLLLYLVLIVAALVVPWFPTYAPIRDAMTLRHLEAQGRSPAQMREREAAARREAEELARQREAEQRQRDAEQRYREAEQRQQEAAARRAAEEQARRQQEADRLATQRRAQEDAERALAGQYTSLAEQFRRDGRALWEGADGLEAGALGAVKWRRSVADASHFRAWGVTPEETATRRACDDPAGTGDQPTRTQRRDHNILACAIYVATTADVRLTEKVAVTILETRLAANTEYKEKTAPLTDMVAYIWLSQWRRQLGRGQDITPLPELTQGDSLNTQLFSDALSPGFAQRMTESATTGERLRLSREVYPALARLSDLGRQLLAACRAARRSTCFDDY